MAKGLIWLIDKKKIESRAIYRLIIFDTNTNTNTLVMIPIPILLQLNGNIFYNVQKKITSFKNKMGSNVDFFSY